MSDPSMPQQAQDSQDAVHSHPALPFSSLLQQMQNHVKGDALPTSTTMPDPSILQVNNEPHEHNGNHTSSALPCTTSSTQTTQGPGGPDASHTTPVLSHSAVLEQDQTRQNVDVASLQYGDMRRQPPLVWQQDGTLPNHSHWKTAHSFSQCQNVMQQYQPPHYAQNQPRRQLQQQQNAQQIQWNLQHLQQVVSKQRQQQQQHLLHQHTSQQEHAQKYWLLQMQQAQHSAAKQKLQQHIACSSTQDNANIPRQNMQVVQRKRSSLMKENQRHDQLPMHPHQYYSLEQSFQLNGHQYPYLDNNQRQTQLLHQHNPEQPSPKHSKPLVQLLQQHNSEHPSPQHSRSQVQLPQHHHPKQPSLRHLRTQSQPPHQQHHHQQPPQHSGSQSLPSSNHNLDQQSLEYGQTQLHPPQTHIQACPLKDVSQLEHIKRRLQVLQQWQKCMASKHSGPPQFVQHPHQHSLLQSHPPEDYSQQQGQVKDHSQQQRQVKDHDQQRGQVNDLSQQQKQVNDHSQQRGQVKYYWQQLPPLVQLHQQQPQSSINIQKPPNSVQTQTEVGINNNPFVESSTPKIAQTFDSQVTVFEKNMVSNQSPANICKNHDVSITEHVIYFEDSEKQTASTPQNISPPDIGSDMTSGDKEYDVFNDFMMDNNPKVTDCLATEKNRNSVEQNTFPVIDLTDETVNNKCATVDVIAGATVETSMASDPIIDTIEIWCHICDNRVPKEELCGHLFFGSVSCVMCTGIIIDCERFRKGMGNGYSLCVQNPNGGGHKFTEWKCQIAYLEFFITNALRSYGYYGTVSGPATEANVNLALIEYLNRFKSLEHSSPWMYAIIPLKKKALLLHQALICRNSFTKGGDQDRTEKRRIKENTRETKLQKTNANQYNTKTKANEHEYIEFHREESLNDEPPNIHAVDVCVSGTSGPHVIHKSSAPDSIKEKNGDECKVSQLRRVRKFSTYHSDHIQTNSHRGQPSRLTKHKAPESQSLVSQAETTRKIHLVVDELQSLASDQDIPKPDTEFQLTNSSKIYWQYNAGNGLETCATDTLQSSIETVSCITGSFISTQESLESTLELETQTVVPVTITIDETSDQEESVDPEGILYDGNDIMDIEAAFEYAVVMDKPNC